MQFSNIHSLRVSLEDPILYEQYSSTINPPTYTCDTEHDVSDVVARDVQNPLHACPMCQAPLNIRIPYALRHLLRTTEAQLANPVGDPNEHPDILATKQRRLRFVRAEGNPDGGQFERQNYSAFGMLTYDVWAHQGRSNSHRWGERHLYESHRHLVGAIRRTTRQVFESEVEMMREIDSRRFARLCELVWVDHERPTGDRQFGEHHLYDSFATLSRLMRTVTEESFAHEVERMRGEHPGRFGRLCHWVWRAHGSPMGDPNYGRNHLYDSYVVLARGLQSIV